MPAVGILCADRAERATLAPKKWHAGCSMGERLARQRDGKKDKKMEAFVVGLIIGVAFGVIIVGFLAVGAYDRGFDEALHRKKAWRAELVLRQAAAHRVLTAMRKAS
jgi:hypothetical protein